MQRALYGLCREEGMVVAKDLSHCTIILDWSSLGVAETIQWSFVIYVLLGRRAFRANVYAHLSILSLYNIEQLRQDNKQAYTHIHWRADFL